jgi:glycosyltransferase involved in cell wall biosynthesis
MNASELKILMISSDRNILAPNSAVAVRMNDYGSLVGELHIVVLAKKSLGLKDVQIGPRVWVYPTNSSSRWSYVSDAARMGKKLVSEKKFVRGRSVITTQDPFECGLVGLKIKDKWRLPLEVQLHTDPFSPYFTGFLNNLRRRIAKKVLAKADTVRVVTPSLRSMISAYTKARISVLPIYVDKESIENARVSFDVHARFGWHFIMLSVARLAPEKNLGLALEILALVRSRFPSTGLVIVGTGPEEASLKALAKKLGVENNVVFEGWLDNLVSHYKTSNAFLQTSHFEGYGMALVEAGLSGLPVVTTPVGLALDLEHGKDAYIYPLDSTRGKPAEAFAEGIVDLIENNEKRENLRLNMKRALDSKLITKQEYLKEMQDNWQDTSIRVKA